MPKPSFCPNPNCDCHEKPPTKWLVRFGTYHTVAHGTVRRYRCRRCGKTMSDQTESLHYFAKRRLPLKAIKASLVSGSSQREIARRYRVSPPAIQNAVLRLGRQSMAAHLRMLSEVQPQDRLVFDGLRTFVTSQDYPCDLTTAVSRQGEVILTATHSIFRRGGRKTEGQGKRTKEKYARWVAKEGSMSGDISLLVHELWSAAQVDGSKPIVIDTDENPLYEAALQRDVAAFHYRRTVGVDHRRTSSTMPRTMENPLFPVNYVDRLMRHRMKEHTRETIAFGRHAVMQMHRLWVFAYDHNCRREYRVRRPAAGRHAEQGVVRSQELLEINRMFYTRRIRVVDRRPARTIARVWLGQLQTPPVRWRQEQKGTSVRIPAYARRDLAGGYQQAG